MITPDGRLVCCSKKFNNCPEVRATRDDGVLRFEVRGDDGQVVLFSIEQFEILIEEGVILLERAGL